jgi:hypothetical protein
MGVAIGRLALVRLALAVAVGLDIDDVSVVNQAVDSSDGHHRVLKTRRMPHSLIE